MASFDPMQGRTMCHLPETSRKKGLYIRGVYTGPKSPDQKNIQRTFGDAAFGSYRAGVPKEKLSKTNRLGRTAKAVQFAVTGKGIGKAEGARRYHAKLDAKHGKTAIARGAAGYQAQAFQEIPAGYGNI